MKTKKLVALCLLLALCTTVLGFGVLGAQPVNAAVANSVFTVNYNSSIATNSVDGGINITIKTNSSTGSVDTSSVVDLNKFAIEFTTLQSGHHYSQLYFKFVNSENDKSGFVVTFEQNQIGVEVKVYDNLNFIDVDAGTEKALITLEDARLSSHYFWLEYAEGAIKVKTKSIVDEGTAEYSALKVICVNENTLSEQYPDVATANFAWVEEVVGSIKPLKEAKLQVGVLEQEKTGDDLGTTSDGTAIAPSTSVINVLSLTNYYGTHVIGSDTLTVRPVVKCSLKEYRGQIIEGTENVFKHKDSNGEWILNDPFNYVGDTEDEKDDAYAGIVANITAAEGQEYVFPFYTIALEKVNYTDAQGETYNSSFDNVQFFVNGKNSGTDEFIPNTEDFSRTSTSKVLSEGEGSTYVFLFTVKIGHDTEDRFLHFAVRITSIKDVYNPVVNQNNFKQWAMENTDFYTDRVIDAPSTGSYVFPTITREDNEKYNIFSDMISNDDSNFDEENDFDNLDVVVGVKTANSVSDYEWSTDTSVNFNQTGSHTIAYKVIDQSGNETIIFSFTVDVQDITAPTISITTANKTKSIEIGKKLEVPTVSRTDNCSGVNSNFNGYTVYWLDYTLNADGYNTDADNKLITSELKEVSLKSIEEGFELTKEMILAKDDGSSKPTFIVVYSATDNAGNVATSTTYSFITVTEKTSTSLDSNPVNETLEIILIVVIAILVVAILVLLFVNPQQRKDDLRMQALIAKEEAIEKEEENN